MAFKVSDVVSPYRLSAWGMYPGNWIAGRADSEQKADMLFRSFVKNKMPSALNLITQLIDKRHIFPVHLPMTINALFLTYVNEQIDLYQAQRVEREPAVDNKWQEFKLAFAKERYNLFTHDSKWTTRFFEDLKGQLMAADVLAEDFDGTISLWLQIICIVNIGDMYLGAFFEKKAKSTCVSKNTNFVFTDLPRSNLESSFYLVSRQLSQDYKWIALRIEQKMQFPEDHPLEQVFAVMVQQSLPKVCITASQLQKDFKKISQTLVFLDLTDNDALQKISTRIEAMCCALEATFLDISDNIESLRNAEKEGIKITSVTNSLRDKAQLPKGGASLLLPLLEDYQECHLLTDCYLCTCCIALSRLSEALQKSNTAIEKHKEEGILPLLASKCSSLLPSASGGLYDAKAAHELCVSTSHRSNGSPRKINGSVAGKKVVGQPVEKKTIEKGKQEIRKPKLTPKKSLSIENGKQEKSEPKVVPKNLPPIGNGTQEKIELQLIPKNSSFINLETAVRDGKVMQDFDSEALPTGDSHSRMVKGSPVGNDSGSKGCVNLPSPTAVSRFKLDPLEVLAEKIFKLYHLNSSIALRQGLWHLDAMISIQQGDIKEEDALILLGATAYSAHKLLEQTYRFCLEGQGIPLITHNLKEQHLALDTSPYPEIVKQLYLANHWTRYFYIEQEKWHSLSTQKMRTPPLLEDLVNLAEGGSLTKAQLQKRVLEIIKKTRLQAENLLSKFKMPIFEVSLARDVPIQLKDSINWDVFEGVKESLSTFLVKANFPHHHPVYLNLKQAISDLSMLKGSLQRVQASKSSREFATWVPFCCSQVQEAMEDVLHAVEFFKEGNVSALHELKILSEKLGLEMGELGTACHHLSFKPRYPAENLGDELGSQIIDDVEVLRQLPDYLEGFTLVEGSFPKILWKAPGKKVSLQGVMEKLIALIEGSETFLSNRAVPALYNSYANLLTCS